MTSLAQMHNLTGKIALILGLGQTSPDGWGIGCAIAVLLARQGAIIVGGNRSVRSAEITKQRIEAEGGICEFYATDAHSSSSVKELVEKCIARHGRIDILINNVGGSSPGSLGTMSEEVWNAQIDVNLNTVFNACRLVVPIMQQQGDGRVVSIASIAGLRHIGKPQVAYAAAKAAIIQTMKVSAVEYANRGIRFNTVVPGLMFTPYIERLAERYGAADDREAKEQYMHMRDQQVPMQRMGDAWDVAHAVLFLVSDEARYITGHDLVVDGGITASTGRT